MLPGGRRVLQLIQRSGRLSITSKSLGACGTELRRLRDEGLIATCNGYWYLTKKGGAE
jgi:hypothetical protein